MCPFHMEADSLSRGWQGELCSSTLTATAHTSNERAMLVVNTRHLGTVFSKSLGGKSRTAGLSRTVIGDLLKSSHPE